MAKKPKEMRPTTSKSSTWRMKEHPAYTYPEAGAGKEAAIYRLTDPAKKGLVHKFWRSDWILQNYEFFRNKKRILERFGDRLAGGTARGFPPEFWNRITLLLSQHTVEVLNDARSAGIPVPAVARVAPQPNKPFYIVELSDLSKPGHEIRAGNQVNDLGPSGQLANAQELREAMDRDLEKLRKLGYVEDKLHPQRSAFLLRINKETRVGEYFLWDTTNLILARAEGKP